MLAVANNSFEQSIALLTAANTTIQNISKASTGLRTIAARIRKTTTGEDDDGEIVEEAKYQEMVNALTKRHVSLVDEVTGQYRSTYDIIRDIAGVWKDMTSMEQAAVVEALAGTRQQNIFASLMTQFGEAEEAMRRMDSSAGELQESYDIYLGSIQAHVQTLNAAFDELSRDFVDSGFAKGAVDILTSIVEALDLLIQKFGVWKTALGTIGGLAALKNLEKLKTLIFSTEMTRNGAWLFEAPTKFEKLAEAILAVNPAVLAAVASVGLLIAGLAKLDQMHSLEDATRQVKETERQLKDLNDQQEINTQKIEYLNTLKARGDFTVQQETELTILQMQNTALQAQIDLLEQRNQKERERQHDLAKDRANDLLTTGIIPNGQIPATQATSLATAVKNYRDWQKAAAAHPNYKGTQAQFEAASHVLEKMLRDAPELIALLNPEEDKDLIDKFNLALQESSDIIAGIPKNIREARNELEQIQKGGGVNLLQRPVIDTNILRAAGWDLDDEDIAATVYSETFSNKDGTIAMNFTPIITDVDGNYIGAFTPEQLQQYAEAVIAGTQEDTLNLKIGATFEGPDAIDQAVEEANKVHELHQLVYEEDLKKIRKFHNDVKTLSSGTLDAVKKYVKDGTNLTKDQAQELQGFLDRYKYSGETFAQMFSQMFAEAPDSLSQSIEKSTADLAGFHDELVKANEALARYKEYMEGGEKDDAVKEAAEIYKGALEDIQSGRVDTNRLHAAAELFLGKDRLKQLGYDIEAVAKELQGSVWQYLFDPNDESEIDYGQRFAEYVRQNLSEASGVWVEGGNTFFYKNLQSVADAFHMSTDAASMFISALDMYGVNVMRSVDDTAELIERFKTLKSELGSTGDAIYQVVSELHADGYDDFEIYEILERLQQAGAIDLNRDQLYASIDEALGKIDELEKKEAEPTTDLNYEPFTASYNAVVDLMKQLNSMTANPTVIMDYAERHVSDSDTKSNSNTSNNTQSAAGTYSKASAGGKQAGSGGGKTLVNEDGPELISDNGRAFIANNGRPGFVTLTKDAIVFNAEDTEEILRRGSLAGVAQAFANGTGSTSRSGLIGRLLSGKQYPAKRQVQGTQVGGSSTSKPSQHSTSTHTNTTSYTTYSTYSNTAWICPNCGRLCGANASYCYGCGWPDHMQSNLPNTNSNYYPDQYGNVTVTYGDGQEYSYNSGYDYSLQLQIAAAQRAHEQAMEALRAAQAAKAEADAKKAAAQQYNTTPKNTTLGKSLAGSGGGNNIGGADYRSYAEPQKVDWVAVRINRLQRTIADLEKIASSGFKKLDTRLRYTKDQITNITDELKVQQQAYDRYIQEANSIGLSESIAANVREGTIDITKYDDDTRKKIDEYTEW